MKRYIEIHQKRCIRCGKCETACPSDVLEMGEESALASYPALCISCGHCAATCPEGAITCNPQNSRAPFTIEDIPGDLPPEHLLFYQKRSVRNFKAEKLPNDVIKTMIQYAEKAPSSHNYRAREYMVVTDEEKIRQMEKIVIDVYRPLVKILNPAVINLTRLFSKTVADQSRDFAASFKNLLVQRAAGEFPVFRNAPCVIMIAAPKAYDQSRDDCVAAQNYMMLYAQTIGIGSCISGYGQYAHKKLARYFKLSKDKQICAISFFGYPKAGLPRAINFTEPAVLWLTG